MPDSPSRDFLPPLRAAPPPSSGVRTAGGATSEMQAALRWLENRDRGAAASRWRRCKRRVMRRLNWLNAPVVYPWSPSRTGTEPAHALHRTAAALLGRRARGPLARAWLGAKALAWPVLATVASGPMLYRWGTRVRERTGLGLLEQWRDLLEAAWRHGIFPTEYYHNRVFRGPARTKKELYLNEREMIALLSAADRGSDAQRIDRVRRLHGECRAAGIPVPRLLATFESGGIELASETEGTLPQKDLFIRPETWRSGDTGQVWRWNAQARAWSSRGEVLTAAGLLQRCRELSARRTILLQECVHNHPEITRFSASGLCTIRFATGIDARGEPRALFAALQIPASGANGPLLAGIDPATGRLEAALGEFVTDGEFETHPGTGAIIAGAALPHWNVLSELVQRAHRRFADVPFVGWEIALGGSGPVLLDATTNWGVFLHVLPAATEFAQLCLQRLEAVRRTDLRVHPLTPPAGDARPGVAPAAAVGQAAAPETPRA